MSLAPGARQLPTSHVSIRVPWHHRAWDGAICDDPRANTSCLILSRIAEENQDHAENSGRAIFWRELLHHNLPACHSELGGFMVPFGFTRQGNHQYAKSGPAHRHFAETPFVHPPYSASCLPFKWLLVPFFLCWVYDSLRHCLRRGPVRSQLQNPLAEVAF